MRYILYNIDKKERKIVFGWKIKENRWLSLQVDEYYFKSDTCNIFIENGSGKVLVDGMNSPHFIKSKFGFMILSNSPLGEYLCTMLDKKIKYIDRCVELICFCFLRAVSDNDLFSVEAFNRCLEDEIPSELQDFYEYVDEQLLNDILQNEKYNIVSLEKLYNAD